LAARNDILSALAEAHFNDIISNSGAIITAAIAYNTIAWWFDPGGAILISIVIIFRWVWIITDQVKKVYERMHKYLYIHIYKHM
jgi:divalent metal cation (Fe/Co/Zn/Cd) transporter